MVWDYLFNNEGQEEEINDISIIKSKNEQIVAKDSRRESGLGGDRDYGYQTDRNSIVSTRNNTKNKHRNEKSYEKKTAKTTLERNNSAGRISSKRSEPNMLNNYISGGMRPISNFYSDN